MDGHGQPTLIVYGLYGVVRALEGRQGRLGWKRLGDGNVEGLGVSPGTVGEEGEEG